MRDILHKPKFMELAPLFLLGVLLFLYTGFLLAYMVPVTGGTDQNGYHVCAKMFNLTGHFYQKPEDDLQFVGSMWVVNERGEYYPKYPPFYPLLCAGMNAVMGDGYGFFATVWGAVLSVAGMFVLVRFWLGRWWALAASLLLALSPVISTLALTKNSHTPSLALFLWGMCCFLTAAMNRKRSFLWAVPGGFLIGWTVGIRYTDFLLILVPLAFGFLFLRGRRRWTVLGALCAGAAVPYAGLALFHWMAYGAPWRSGYSLTDESRAFEPRFIWTNLQIYLPEFFVTVLGPMGVLSLIVSRKHWRRLFFWLAWILPTFGLYLMYYWAPEAGGTGTMRFLTPLVPCLILLIVLSLRRITLRLKWTPLTVSTLLLLFVLQIIWGWTQTTRMCEPKYAGDLPRMLYVDFARRTIPEGAILFANSGLLNELDYEKRWTLYSSMLMNPREIKKTVERSLGAQAAGLQHERAAALQKKLGHMNYAQIYAFLRQYFDDQYRNGRDVYFLGRTWEVNNFRRIFYRYFEIEKVGAFSADRPLAVFRNLKPDASRYLKKKETVPIPPCEIVRIGRKRLKTLSAEETLKMLQQERSELVARLNQERDPLVSDTIARIEAIRDEMVWLRRSIADAKRRSEQARRKRAEAAKKAKK